MLLFAMKLLIPSFHGAYKITTASLACQLMKSSFHVVQMGFRVGSSNDLEVKFPKVVLPTLKIPLMHRNLWIRLCQCSYEAHFNLWLLQKVWKKTTSELQNKRQCLQVTFRYEKAYFQSTKHPFLHVLRKHLFWKHAFLSCFSSECQTSFAAIQWFLQNDKLKMKVLKYNNANFPLFFISDMILSHSFIDIMKMDLEMDLDFMEMEQTYDCVEVLEPLSDYQK